MKAGTAVFLIVISLAAVGGVAYGSYRASTQTDTLETRLAVLEEANVASAETIGRLEEETADLCASVGKVRQKITGVVLQPDSPTPNFDLESSQLTAPERIILMLYNWCTER